MNAGEFTFANPGALAWAWAVLAFAALVAFRARGRARALGRLADLPQLRSIAPRPRSVMVQYCRFGP